MNKYKNKEILRFLVQLQSNRNPRHTTAPKPTLATTPCPPTIQKTTQRKEIFGEFKSLRKIDGDKFSDFSSFKFESLMDKPVNRKVRSFL